MVAPSRRHAKTELSPGRDDIVTPSFSFGPRARVACSIHIDDASATDWRPKAAAEDPVGQFMNEYRKYAASTTLSDLPGTGELVQTFMRNNLRLVDSTSTRAQCGDPTYAPAA
jgi:hypothetical protein